jgi:hypothetical protein
MCKNMILSEKEIMWKEVGRLRKLIHRVSGSLRHTENIRKGLPNFEKMGGISHPVGGLCNAIKSEIFSTEMEGQGSGCRRLGNEILSRGNEELKQESWKTYSFVCE